MIKGMTPPELQKIIDKIAAEHQGNWNSLDRKIVNATLEYYKANKQ